MRPKFLYVAAVVVLASACNKLDGGFDRRSVDAEAERKMITETVSGSYCVSTRATIADVDASFAWTQGDNIAVHVSDGTEGKYVFTSDAGAAGASTSAVSASFTLVYEDSYARESFAVYPSTLVSASSANYGQSGQSLDVTLPSSYTLDQVRGLASPCPMIAANSAGSGLEFFQLCGLLRLTVNSIPPSTKRLEIDFNGKKVCGDFSIAAPVNPESSAISTVNDDNNDVITITKDGSDVTLNNGNWLDGLVLNIPLPIGTYTDITVTAYDALTVGNAVLTMTRPFAYEATREYGTKKTASFPVFSVGANKRVIFAPGNLQATYDASTHVWSWGFAPNQYESLGASSGNMKVNGNGSLSENGVVDLFGFSTSNTYFGISDSWSVDLFSGTFVDWGQVVDGYASDFWRTLTESEWQYVVGEDDPAHTPLYYRQTGGVVSSISNALCTKATVVGKKGFILFPDYYSGYAPAGVNWAVNFISQGNMAKSGEDGWGTLISSADDWAALEKDGCVFLPVSGFRAGYYGVYYIEGGTSGDTTGYYIASSPTSGAIKTLRFNYDGFDPNQGVNRGYGCAVRLVHEIN